MHGREVQKKTKILTRANFYKPQKKEKEHGKDYLSMWKRLLFLKESAVIHDGKGFFHSAKYSVVEKLLFVWKGYFPH